MKKRSAILMAAGLVVALLSGAVAMTIGLSGNGAAEAGGRAKQDPIVRTIRRTVTVHKDANPSDQASVEVVRLSSSSSTMSGPSVSESDDDASESEGEDSYESEDRSGDDSTDQSSDDSSQSGSGSESGDD